MMQEILQHLKKHGVQMDTEIAKAVGISLSKAHAQLAELAAVGEIVTCHMVRFEKGQKIEGECCRLSGFMPKAAPGRKPKVQ